MPIDRSDRPSRRPDDERGTIAASGSFDSVAWVLLDWAASAFSTISITLLVAYIEKVVFTGRKLEKKNYYHHTGFIGGIKERSAKFIMEGRFPERIVEKAVERMLPRGPLGRQQFSNLRVYKGPAHPHVAQQPVALDIGSLNPKNKRSA